jgi:translation initiation factor IF-3
VRVISESGTMIGIMDFNKAMNLANERGYDLILISSGDIPVTKIADYSKMLYEQKKKEKENKKNQNTPKLKEIDFGLNIGNADFNTKIKKVREFLLDKDNVKLVVKMDRRIATNNSQMGYDFMNKILNELNNDAICQNKPKLMGNLISVVVISKK